MKTSKRILTAVLSSALSAIMLFGSTTTALAVENNMVAVSKSTIPGWVDERFTDELKESISKMDYFRGKVHETFGEIHLHACHTSGLGYYR